MNSQNKYKLKGNESFNIREGWLNKGIRAIQDQPDIFSSGNAADVLGVGTKMVKAIRFWLLASSLAVERINRNARRTLHCTMNLGDIVMEYDRYFEDIFTLWIIHYNIVKRDDMCTVWSLFFNNFSADEFTKSKMVDSMAEEFKKYFESTRSVYNSIEDDCLSILKMYNVVSSEENIDPEDNTSSPFSELGLIKRSDTDKSKYLKLRPLFDKLDRHVVLYIMVDNLASDRNSVSFDALINDPNNVGKVLNLDRNLLNEYLDQLKQDGYITVNRTAGLDMVYFNDVPTPAEVLRAYYNQVEREM